MKNYLIILLLCFMPLKCSFSNVRLVILRNMEKKLHARDKAIVESKTKLDPIPTSCPPYVNYYGLYTIKVPNWNTTQVFCNTLGWTVIQRRLGGPVDFNGTWSEYRNGFGYLADEFFLGLEAIHRITTSEQHELYISLTDCKNETTHAWYDNFVIGGEETGYMLNSLGSYNGTAGDSMRLNLGKKFTTKDRDNDDWPGYNCASLMNGGWWYTNCGLSNLNGPYRLENGVIWHTWREWETLTNVEMMIRRKSVHF